MGRSAARSSVGRPGSSAAGSIAEGVPPPAGEFWAAGLDRGCTCILVPGDMSRRDAHRMMLAGGRASDCDRTLVPHPRQTRQVRCRQRWMVGNLSGNPGATTRHYGMAVDGIGPAPEQPGWC